MPINDSIDEKEENELSNNLNSSYIEEKKYQKNNEVLNKNGNFDEKKTLKGFLENLKDELEKSPENKLDKIYANNIDRKFIANSHIKEDINVCFLRFIFLFMGPLYGIIFLIGIFQMKSILNALADLIKSSFVDFFYCNVKSKCEINTNEGKTSVYDFFNYYYNFTMNETINFNLMMMTAFIGDLLLKWKGFRLSTCFLIFPSVGATIWLWNFNFSFEVEGIFNYDILKIINLAFIYILLLCGVGGSALLAQQVLIEGHLKYKDYLKNIDDEKNGEKNREIKEEKKENIIELDLTVELKPENNKKTRIYTKKKLYEYILDQNSEEDKVEDDDNSSLNSSRTIVKTKDPKPYLEKILEKIRKKQKKKLKKLNSIKETNKFDYFFIICITTIIGYLGKYSINFLLDYILILIFKENYDKKIFLISTLILYGISVCFSLFIYEFLYKRCIFIYENKEEKDKIIKISKICGYIIYSEERKPTNPAKRNCCTLCFENIQNCFDNTFCYIIKKATSICCDWEPKCCCCCYCCCKYDKEDYNKKKKHLFIVTKHKEVVIG